MMENVYQIEMVVRSRNSEIRRQAERERRARQARRQQKRARKAR